MSSPTSEVVVVGGGPAGAATAILLARGGHEVVLVDRARFPRDKICGEYLSPEGLRILDRLGVLPAIEGGGGRPLRGMRITGPGGRTLLADYPRAGPWRGFRDHGLTARRTTFDAALVARARREGVVVREGFRVTDVLRAGTRVAGVEGLPSDGGPSRIPARLVVAADGRTSVVARRLGLVRPHPWLRRMAFTTHLAGVAVDPERAEIFVAPPIYAILNPVGGDVVNASLVVPLSEGARHARDRETFLLDRLAAVPELAPRLARARRTTPVRALGPLAYRVDPPRQGGVILVGDTLGFLDPFTGEGLHAALRSAELAAEVGGAALDAGDLSAAALAPVRRRHRAERAGKARLAALLQVVIGHRPVADWTARRLCASSAALDRLMGVLGDFVPARALLDPWLLWHLVLSPGGARSRRELGGCPTEAS